MSLIGFFDKTDVATAFDPRDADCVDAVGLGIQPKVLVQVVLADVISSHHFPKHAAILHDDFGGPFEEETN